MATPYELLAGLALLREKKRSLRSEHEQDLKEWAGFSVHIGQQVCLIPCDQVEEVMTISSFAGIRGVPAFVRGVAFFRAQLLTVVDMLAFLLPQWRPNSISKVFVVRGQQEWFGLQIGEFDGVRHVWSDTPSAPMPAHLSNSWQRYTDQWLSLEGQIVAVLNARNFVKALEKGELDNLGGRL